MAPGPPIYSEHTSKATIAFDENGHRWVRKAVGITGLASVQAEAIWWLLARELELPVPDAAFHCEENNEAWLSAFVEPVQHWDPAYATYVTNPHHLGGILALDAITGNDDRHPRNIILQVHGPNEVTMSAIAIDGGDAAVGDANELDRLGLQPPMPHPACTGFPWDLVAPGAEKTAEAMSKMGGGLVEEIVQEACQLSKADGEEADRVFGAICRRGKVATDIVSRYIRKIKALP